MITSLAGAIYYSTVSTSFFFLIIRRPTISTLTDTLFPYTTLFRSQRYEVGAAWSQVAKSSGETYLNLKIGAPEFGPNWVRARTQFGPNRSEEHTSELQSLMRISYAVFCLKKKKQTSKQNKTKTKTTETHKSQYPE